MQGVGCRVYGLVCWLEGGEWRVEGGGWRVEGGQGNAFSFIHILYDSPPLICFTLNTFRPEYSMTVFDTTSVMF